MENLNKENFWNNLNQFYPQAMAEFCDWIDRYKLEVRWVFLFSGEEIKFHDLPFDMQVGIIGRFMREKHGQVSSQAFREMVCEDTTRFFLEREKTLTHG